MEIFKLSLKGVYIRIGWVGGIWREGGVPDIDVVLHVSITCIHRPAPVFESLQAEGASLPAGTEMRIFAPASLVFFPRIRR